MDKRILRTRRKLGSALIELLLESPLHRITVRQITERADVAYSTFFRNFETVEDVLHTYLEAFLTELQTLIDDIEADSLPGVFRQIVQLIFEHMSQNQAMYRIVLTTPAIYPVFAPFKQTLIARNVEMAQALMTHFREDSPPLELLICNAVNSQFIIIEWYLAQETIPDIETITTYYEKTVTFPMWRLLLGDDKASSLLNIPVKK